MEIEPPLATQSASWDIMLIPLLTVLPNHVSKHTFLQYEQILTYEAGCESMVDCIFMRPNEVHTGTYLARL